MPTYNINSDDPMEMIWAVREKIYEETRDMTNSEFNEYLRRNSAEARLKMKEIQPDDYDFPFLRGKTV